MNRTACHVVSTVCLAGSIAIAHSASQPQPVLVEQAQGMIMQQGKVPISYQGNGYGTGMAGLLFMAGVAVQLYGSFGDKWRQATDVQPTVQQPFLLEQPILLEPPPAPPVQPEPVVPAPVAPLSMRSVAAETEKQEQESWLDTFLFKPDGSVRHANVKIEGPTGAGKTTLGEEVMRRMAKDSPNVERFLINPKHLAFKQTWSFPPYCDSIEDVPQAMRDFLGMMKARISDSSFNPETAHHRFYVIDEHDWNTTEHGIKYLSPLRSLVKVCREVMDHVVLLGQSSYANKGLDGSDYRQMGRIILGSEAIAFFNNSQFAFSNKAELQAKAEGYHAQQRRFALVIPSEGMPAVYLVPTIKRNLVKFPHVAT